LSSKPIVHDWLRDENDVVWICDKEVNHGRH
jgi:hypothetical protein